MEYLILARRFALLLCGQPLVPLPGGAPIEPLLTRRRWRPDETQRALTGYSYHVELQVFTHACRSGKQLLLKSSLPALQHFTACCSIETATTIQVFFQSIPLNSFKFVLNPHFANILVHAFLIWENKCGMNDDIMIVIFLFLVWIITSCGKHCLLQHDNETIEFVELAKKGR